MSGWREAKVSDRWPRVGLALGGGGARGFAHIGVIRVLQSHGIPIDLVTGTSIGAVIGGAFAYGLDLNRLEQLLETMDLNRLLELPRSDFEEVKALARRLLSEQLFRRGKHDEIPPDRRMERLCQFMTTFLGDAQFQDLRLPFAAIAADIETGERVAIREGRICRAIEASSAIPGIYGPVLHRGRKLIDGGVVDPVPIDVAFELGADVVIAVDVSPSLSRPVRGALKTFFQAEAILLRELARTKYALAQARWGDRLVLLRPDVAAMHWFEFERIPELVARGEREALKHGEEIQKMLHIERDSIPWEGLKKRRKTIRERLLSGGRGTTGRTRRRSEGERLSILKRRRACAGCKKSE